MLNLAKAAAENAFAKLNTNHEHSNPEWSWEQWLKSGDDTMIYSWWFDNYGNNRKGTLLLLHGFMGNCGGSWLIDKSKALADKHGLCIGAIDFRGHGKSQLRTPSFGCAESLDVKAAINYADSINAPKPYIIIGESFGGMAAQLTAITDSRVNAVICLQTPGWPWDAIGAQLFNLGPLIVGVPIVGKTINGAYGYDILSSGDIRRKPSNPEHEPFVLYVMGWDDKFNINHTKEIWDHWYAGAPAEYNKWPADAPNQKKWFIAGPWVHTDQNWEQSVFCWDGLEGLVTQFIEHVLNSRN